MRSSSPRGIAQVLAQLFEHLVGLGQVLAVHGAQKGEPVRGKWIHGAVLPYRRRRQKRQRGQGRDAGAVQGGTPEQGVRQRPHAEARPEAKPGRQVQPVVGEVGPAHENHHGRGQDAPGQAGVNEQRGRAGLRGQAGEGQKRQGRQGAGLVQKRREALAGLHLAPERLLGIEVIKAAGHDRRGQVE
jgi:hypothetical protein